MIGEQQRKGSGPRIADCGRVPRLVLPPVCRRVLVLGRQVERRRFTTIKKSVAAQPAGQTAKPKGTQRHDISNPGETAGVILPDDYAQRGHGFRNMQAGAQRIGGALEVTTNRPGEDMTATQLQEASKLTACTPTRVMLVDNHPITRAGLQEALEHSGEFEVVGQAGDGMAAVEAARNLRPDVIIMDVIMPLKNGIDACREITDLLPDTRVLMLTAHTEPHAVIEAIAAGATGYLPKFSGKDQILTAVRDVAAGQYTIPNDEMHQVFTAIRAIWVQVDPPPERLTTRDQEILTLFAKGLSYTKIAEAVDRRPVTIRNTIYRIQDKLECTSKQEIVVWAVRHGLLNPDQ